MEIHLKIIGFTLMILAAIHVIFPSYFNWKEELSRLSLINRQMFKVHTFFIALTVFLMGLLSFSKSERIVHTELGKSIALGLGLFWACRLFFQLFIYSKELWKGKIFETVVHVFFTAFWIYMSAVFFIAAFQ